MGILYNYLIMLNVIRSNIMHRKMPGSNCSNKQKSKMYNKYHKYNPIL